MLSPIGETPASPQRRRSSGHVAPYLHAAVPFGTNSNGNCNAVYNSQVTHNGTAVREQAQSGTRRKNVQTAQALSTPCPGQLPK